VYLSAWSQLIQQKGVAIQLLCLISSGKSL